MADQIQISVDFGTHKIDQQLDSIYNKFKTLDVTIAKVRTSLGSLESVSKQLSRSYIEGRQYANAYFSLVNQKIRETINGYTKLNSLFSEATNYGGASTNTGPNLVDHFKKAAYEAEKVKNQVDKINRSFGGSNDKSSYFKSSFDLMNQKLREQQKYYVDGTKYTSAYFNLMKQKIDETTPKLSKFQQGLNYIGREFKATVGITSLATASVRSFYMYLQELYLSIPRNIVEISKLQAEYLGFRNALAVAEGSIGAANQSLLTAIKIATDLKLPINVVTKEYTKFMNAVRLVGFDVEEATTAFRDLSMSARVLNLSPESTSGMFLALEQMVSKGVVSMEELRRQLGNALPGAVDIAALAFQHKLPAGLNTAEEKIAAFIQMVKKGEVSSVEFLKSFIPFLKARTEEFLPESLKTFQAALTDLSNQFEIFKIGLGSMISEGLTPFFDLLTSGLKSINSYLNSLGFLGSAQETFVDQVRKSSDEIDKNIDDIIDLDRKAINLTESMSGMQLAFFGVIGATTGLAPALFAIKKIFSGIGAAVTFLFSPFAKLIYFFSTLGTRIGLLGVSFASFISKLTPTKILITAITVAITALIAKAYSMRQSIDEINNTFDESINKLDAFRQAAENAKRAMNIKTESINRLSYLEGEKKALDERIASIKESIKTIDEQRQSVATFLSMDVSDNPIYKILTADIKVFEDSLKKANGEMSDVDDKIALLRSSLLNLSKSLKTTGSVVSEVFSELSNELTDELHELQLSEIAFFEYELRINGVRDATEKLTEEQIKDLVNQKKLNLSIEEANDARKEQQKLAEERIKKLKEEAEKYNELIASVEDELRMELLSLTLRKDALYEYQLIKSGVREEDRKDLMEMYRSVEAYKEFLEENKRKVVSFDIEKTSTPYVDYIDSLKQGADSIESAYVNAFQSMEDALVEFVTTGKFEFRGFAQSIIAEITRMIAKQMIFNALTSIFGTGTGMGGGSLGAMLGIGGAPVSSVPIPTGTFATGTNYLKQDTIAMLHKGEAVVPAKYNPYNPHATNTVSNTTNNVERPVNIINVPDESSLRNFLLGSDGEQIIMNHISRNQNLVRQAL